MNINANTTSCTVDLECDTEEDALECLRAAREFFTEVGSDLNESREIGDQAIVDRYMATCEDLNHAIDRNTTQEIA